MSELAIRHDSPSTGTCPLCNGAATVWQVIRGLPIEQCDHCGHRFYCPQEKSSHLNSVYGDDYFFGSSQGYQDYLAEEAIQRRSARYYLNRLHSDIAKLSSSKRLLDVGCACGFLMSEFRNEGWTVQGLEPNATMRQIGIERFGVDSKSTNIEELPNNCQFEMIAIVQVLSHLLDPRSAIKAAYERLTKPGLLLIETWDRDSLFAKVSGKNWHEYNPPSVLHWFTRNSLKLCVCEQGFEYLYGGLPRKAIQLGRAINMLRQSYEHSAVAKILTLPLTVVPSRLTVPYLLGDAFWMLFRK